MADETVLSYQPDSVTHPGDTIVDYLDAHGWSQRDLARRTGLTPKTISEICSGKAPVTPATSLALEKVFRRPAHFWLNLQRRHDEARERKKASERLSEWDQWVRRFPINDMKRYRWVSSGTGAIGADALLTFFGVSSPQSWKAVWEATSVSYRQTRRFETSVEAISAWIRATELQADEIRTKDFDEERVRSLIPELRTLTREPAERFVDKVQTLCAEAGVAVVWVPELPQTGISGCARWLSERKALVGLTLRHKTDDQMWFTFFHELGHLLLHRSRSAFILDNAVEDLGDTIVDPEMQRNEEEASRFAADILIPPENLADFLKRNSFTNEAVLQFAEKLHVGPGIIVGRLQKEGLLARHQGNALKRRFNWALPPAE